jgi:phosphatidylglycerol---prolipoprotein diacylglyceryl transferase
MTLFGLFAAAGGVMAILWLKSRHRQIGVSQNEFWAGTWLTFFGAIIGAKILFVILGWHHYTNGELHFWSDFRTGFVFFGGLLGALTAGGLFAWWRGLNFWRGADYFAVALPLGHAIGRVGCFLNGCCPGRPSHPVQLYESMGLLAISLVCLVLLKRVETSRLAPGTNFCAYLFLYGLLRLLLDPLRADGRPERFWGLSHQQGFAIAFILLAGMSALLINRDRLGSVNTLQRSRS